MKHYTKVVKDYSFTLNKRRLPLNAVYGRCTTSHGDTMWYCDDLQYYNGSGVTDASGEYIDVHIYDASIFKWVERRINRGQIYRDLETAFMTGMVKIGTRCKYPYDFKGTYQYSVPLREKHKSFSEANKRYYDRGSKGGNYTWELRKDTGLISMRIK